MVNGDIFCDWDPAAALALDMQGRLAHLVLVDNPPHHPAGDFALVDGRVGNQEAGRLTFAGIGIYAPALFAGLDPDQPAKLAPLLRTAADAGQVSGERHGGRWVDVGTPERLRELDQELLSK